MASIIHALLFCILDTEGSMEMDATVQALLNDYIDLRYSVYVTLVTVSVESKFYNLQIPLGICNAKLEKKQNYLIKLTEI
jgi:hypothetical protein